MSRIDLTGNKYGRLTAIRYSHTVGKVAFWLFRCDCGNEHVAASQPVRVGSIKSCGCLRREVSSQINFKHGQAKNSESQSRLYRIWSQMKRRCDLPTVKAFPNYGGRGITVCEDWANDFRTFENWALSNGYSDDLTIDRINNDGNYEPSNCRWATEKEQANNRRSSRIITYENKNYTLAQLSELKGLHHSSLSNKLNQNLTAEEAVQKLIDKKEKGD